VGGFVSIPCCARIATRVWNTNEDRFRPRAVLILVFVLFLVSRHHQRYLVAGSRQSTASAIDSQCCNVHKHTLAQKHTHLRGGIKTHTLIWFGWRAGHKVRLFVVFVFARDFLVFRFLCCLISVPGFRWTEFEGELVLYMIKLNLKMFITEKSITFLFNAYIFKAPEKLLKSMLIFFRS